MIALIVNGDDYGLSNSVSSGILRAHRDGILTSCSVIGNCDDLKAVSRTLRSVPTLGTGLHLNLYSGRPLSRMALRSRLALNGRFLEAVVPVLNAVLRVDANVIEAEFDAQVERAEAGGLSVDHLDTHLHLGCVPTVRRALNMVSRRHGIPTRTIIRDPVRHLRHAPVAGVLKSLVLCAASTFVGEPTRGPRSPQTCGVAQSGSLGLTQLCHLLSRLRDGVYEILCHPADDDGPHGIEQRRQSYRGRLELHALTSDRVKAIVSERRIELCRWADVAELTPAL
jgi:chitin disaccharide deacetylase